jgi:hypothetical protein
MPLKRHDHLPLYRVGRAGWSDPLDASFSTSQSNRWNPVNTFPVLYTCCSENVARAVVHNVFHVAAVELQDLRPEVRPILAELSWAGSVVDMCSVEGIIECGFNLVYPQGSSHQHTQMFAQAWHGLGAEGVMCRSESVFKVRHRGWVGDHRPWSEVAIFVRNAATLPTLVSVRSDFDWEFPTDSSIPS